MKKTAFLFAIVSAALLFVSGCAATPAAQEQRDNDIVSVSFDFEKQGGYASNQYAVWIEDADGTLVKTLFVTNFTAKGGYQKRPDAIPVWVERSAAGTGVPDGVSGATPKSGSVRYVWDLTDQSGARVANGTYTFFVEGTLRWKNQVLYSGELVLDGNATTAEATAEYTYAASGNQPALNADSPENAMIGNVKAEYIPPMQP